MVFKKVFEQMYSPYSGRIDWESKHYLVTLVFDKKTHNHAVMIFDTQKQEYVGHPIQFRRLEDAEQFVSSKLNRR